MSDKTWASVAKSSSVQPRPKEIHIEPVKITKQQPVSRNKSSNNKENPIELLNEKIAELKVKLEQVKRDQEEFQRICGKKDSELKKQIDSDEARKEQLLNQLKKIDSDIEAANRELVELENEKQNKMKEIVLKINQLMK